MSGPGGREGRSGVESAVRRPTVARRVRPLSSDIVSNLLLLAPAFLYLMGLRFGPLLYTGWLSLTQWNLVRDAEPAWVGLRNFWQLMSDQRFHHALLVSLQFMVAATAIEVPLGVGLALLLNRDFRFKSAVRGVFLIPMVTSPVAVGTIWYILYNSKIGPITYALQSVGVPTQDWLGSPTTALWALVLADVWEWTPFVFILAMAALKGVPGTLYEAASVDGATPLQVVLRITLPLIRGVVSVAALLRAMDAFKVFETVYVMTGGGPGRLTETASLLVYKTAFTHLDFGYAASMVVVILLITGAIFFAYTQLQVRGGA